MKIFGCAGNAKCGKDNFADLSCKFFRSQKLVARKFALADALKSDLDTFIQTHFGFSAFTSDPKLKTLIRPILVAYGCAKRNHTRGKHWTGILQKYINAHSEFLDVAIVTDIRFDEFHEDGDLDEYAWLKSLGANLIFLTRKDKNDNLIPPANDCEAFFNPSLQQKADYQIEWGKEDDSYKFVEAFLQENHSLWKK